MKWNRDNLWPALCVLTLSLMVFVYYYFYSCNPTAGIEMPKGWYVEQSDIENSK